MFAECGFTVLSVRSDLFQHRLWLGEPGKWQDVLVPFSDFTLTNAGTMSETQIEMFREKVHSNTKLDMQTRYLLTHASLFRRFERLESRCLGLARVNSSSV